MSAGVLGYRPIKEHIDRNKILLSYTTVHVYINKKLNLNQFSQAKGNQK